LREAFFETAAPRAADLVLILEIAMGVGLLVGARLARKGRFRQHAWCQSSIVLLNLAVVVVMMIQRATRIQRGNTRKGLGHAGRRKEAKRHLDQLLKKYEYVPCWFLAMAWVGLNDTERAVEALEQAFRDHEPCMVSLKVDAIFDPLRKEKRYKDMVRGVGLEP
jgi:predicted TIM-barrel fold metal-dependent hydrolase